MVKIIDTVPYFINNYENSIEFLQSYYKEYPEIFKEYFAYHCKDTEERHLQSLSKYPQQLPIIEQVHNEIAQIIHDITEQFTKMYGMSYPIDVNLIIGGFGSNAYTHRQIIPNVTFALERLSPNKNHLKTIVAHELGHVTHNMMTDAVGVDWKDIQWTNPLIWLHQEGVATHFSKQIVPNLPEAMYFSFNDEGEEWLQFAKSHKEEIKQQFVINLTEDPTSIFKEWFSINGGKTFGYSRLAYFLGDWMFQELLVEKGEQNAITAWRNNNFLNEVEKWLMR